MLLHFLPFIMQSYIAVDPYIERKCLLLYYHHDLMSKYCKKCYKLDNLK